MPFWWIDIGATMQNIMLAAVNEGLGCGFVGRTSTAFAPTWASPTSSSRSGSCRSAAAAGRPLTEPQARLGPVRGVRALGTLGLSRERCGPRSRVADAAVSDMPAIERRELPLAQPLHDGENRGVDESDIGIGVAID